jgi:hypothetical protein
MMPSKDCITAMKAMKTQLKNQTIKKAELKFRSKETRPIASVLSTQEMDQANQKHHRAEAAQHEAVDVLDREETPTVAPS